MTYDWTEFDIATIPEADFPVHCDQCAYDLTGLGDRSRCPECGTGFERRERLWTIHGPEAFAEPQREESGPARTERRFAVAMFAALACAASIPASIVVWQRFFGTFDLLLWFVTWLLILSCVEWILAVREHLRPEEESPEREGSEHGDA